MTIWYILSSFVTFFSGFGILYQEKSGNPGTKTKINLGELALSDGNVEQKIINNRMVNFRAATARRRGLVVSPLIGAHDAIGRGIESGHRSQSYDRELQRQRCKFLQRHG
jgi:hypothetical protein